MGGGIKIIFIFSFFTSNWAFAYSCQLLANPSVKGQAYNITSAVEYILVSKSQRRMLLFSKTGIKEYSVRLGFNPVGPKQQEGDGKTPEGLYSISYKKNPSQYHKSLMLNYPREKDIVRAKELGVKPGHSIAIHGLPSDKAEYDRTLLDISMGKDWTQGCIAVSNSEINEIFPLVKEHTPVEICP